MSIATILAIFLFCLVAFAGYTMVMLAVILNDVRDIKERQECGRGRSRHVRMDVSDYPLWKSERKEG